VGIIVMHIHFILLYVLVSSALNADNKFARPCSLIYNLNMIEQSSFMKKMPWMFTEDNGQWTADFYDCFLQ
jgi:peptidoglycan biosynthesis protein MviN/MurJ (putative lipid II flippase)